jgi:hypothetical protein
MPLSLLSDTRLQARSRRFAGPHAKHRRLAVLAAGAHRAAGRHFCEMTVDLIMFGIVAGAIAVAIASAIFFVSERHG